MKVEMAIVKKQYLETRALEPEMMGKPFMVDERYADKMELVSRGKIRRTARVSDVEPRRRGRPRKVVEE